MKKEFRIGNYINFWNNTLIVSELSEFKINAKNDKFGSICENYIEVSGVKITQSIYYKIENQLIDLAFEYSFNKGKLIFYFSEYYQLEFEYLHQVQNFYFALTNKELEIKL